MAMDLKRNVSLEGLEGGLSIAAISLATGEIILYDASGRCACVPLAELAADAEQLSRN